MKLYLSLVQDDWADKSASASCHLTPVDEVLQLANLHSALKPSTQRLGSVHRASPAIPIPFTYEPPLKLASRRTLL